MILFLINACSAVVGVFAGIFLPVSRLVVLSPLVFAGMLPFARVQGYSYSASVALAVLAVVVLQAGYLAGVLFRTWRNAPIKQLSISPDNAKNGSLRPGNGYSRKTPDSQSDRTRSTAAPDLPVAGR